MSFILYVKCRTGEAPRAYVVKESSSDLTAEKIHNYVKANAAPYKQLTGGIEFIEVIPKSLAGKVLRKNLVAKYSKDHGWA